MFVNHAHWRCKEGSTFESNVLEESHFDTLGMSCKSVILDCTVYWAPWVDLHVFTRFLCLSSSGVENCKFVQCSIEEEKSGDG